MKHNRLAKALNKNNIEFEEVKEGYFKAVGLEGNYVTWHLQGDEAICVGLRNIALVDDPMTDLFYGSYTDRIKRVVGHLKNKYE